MRRFRSKRDLYDYLDRVMVSFSSIVPSILIQYLLLQQIFLPRLKACSLLHLQDLLLERKRFLYRSEVRTLRVPLLPELAVAKIWPEAIKLPRFIDYMPTGWTASSKKTERPYFWGVLTSLAEPYVEQLLLDVKAQRIQAA